MLHDEFISNWKNLNKGVQEMIAAHQWGNLKKNKPLSPGDLRTERHIREMAVCADITSFFYYDDFQISNEFISTALKFYGAGLLQLPFPNSVFIFRGFVPDPEDVARVEKETGRKVEEKDTSTIAVLVYENTDRDFIFTFLDMDNGHHKGDSRVMRGCPLAMIIYKRSSIEHINFEDKTYGAGGETIELIPLMMPGPDDTGQSNWSAERANIIKLCGASMNLAFQGMLALNMPHYDKQENEISEKLNRARFKSGKEPLKGFTTVKLRKEIQASLDKQSREAGYTVRPHWRRGHIRRLASGKLIPVSPCTINYDDAGLLPKNTYFVDDKKDA